MDAVLLEVLATANEILTAAIVIIAASLLLYNLTRNLHDRVARTSGIVLGCLTAVYLCDTFVALGPAPSIYALTLRLQWYGIAFMPVAMYHLSDALLATTGLPSRGRRRRVIRLLYLIALGFFILAAFTDSLVIPMRLVSPLMVGSENLVSVERGPVFFLYVAYFLIVTTAAFLNVQRARVRCIARSTRRRMGYLQIAMLTPAGGIFPFALLLGVGTEQSIIGLTLVNLANIIVILMLIFLSYPLSFFGTRIPDRLVKIELLRFLLRGPGTGLLALGTIILTTSGSRVFSLPGDEFMPFAVVAVVLLWQWSVALGLPALERWLVYPADDADQIEKLQDLSDRLLTRTDLLQQIEALLASLCDYVRVSSAFVASVRDGMNAEMVSAMGPMIPDVQRLAEQMPTFTLHSNDGTEHESDSVPIRGWNGFWLVPLYSSRNGDRPLVGVLGIQARAQTVDLSSDDNRMLSALVHRASQALDDLSLQGELFAALEGLLPQVALTRSRANSLEYRQGRPEALVENGDSGGVDEEQFKEQVRAALRHYWGGPGLTSSRLLETESVKRLLPDNDNNPVKTLRALLNEGIEKMRPEGERKYITPEWTLYNILEMRFIQQIKVRDVAQRLVLGESDLYRKQRVAIDQLADMLWKSEQDLRKRSSP
ncbi:MAG: hypothetical protein L6Q98_03640 [Anaerolineae bacterium]|nr:hypothetical protein [Anaerolineae bacterium]NUQ02312.1 hypothetical protein [Anaerolineae bacterium]